MVLSNNEKRLIVRLLENRLSASYDPDVANLLERMQQSLKSGVVSLQGKDKENE